MDKVGHARRLIRSGPVGVEWKTSAETLHFGMQALI